MPVAAAHSSAGAISQGALNNAPIEEEALDRFAKEAWDSETPLTELDEARIDAARARVLAFAKDCALLDWLDAPEPEWPAEKPAPQWRATNGAERGSVTWVASELEAFPIAPPGATPSPEELYDHFRDGLTNHTREAYGEDLEHFARWLGKEDARSAVAHLLRQGAMGANQLVLGWSNAMAAEGYAPTTRARRLSALRSTIKLANAFGVVDWKIHLRSPKVQKVRDTRGVEPIDVRKMVAACDDNLEGLRNELLVSLLFTLGLRKVEVVRLLVKHYDRERRRLLIHGKGFERDPNKVQWRDVPSDLSELIEEWISRGHGTDAAELPLFYGWQNNHRTEKLTGRGVHYIVSKLGERVGVRVWPHSFRHASVTTALKEGHQLHEVQRHARHESPATTQIYNDDVNNAAGRVAETLSRVLKRES